MRQIDALGTASYGGAIIAVLSSLTINQIAGLVGLLTAIITALISNWHTVRKNAREEAQRAEEAREHALRMRELEGKCGQCESRGVGHGA
jgi:hypothetical protein